MYEISRVFDVNIMGEFRDRKLGINDSFPSWLHGVYYRVSVILVILSCLGSSWKPATAATPEAKLLDFNVRTYIIQVAPTEKPAVFTTHRSWYESTVYSVRELRRSQLLTESKVENDILHTYSNVFNGFAARLSAAEAEAMEQKPGVLKAYPEQMRQLHTTYTPKFLGLNYSTATALTVEAKYGQDVIIGVLDTGVWPERESFSDHDMEPVPARWKGKCVDGSPSNSSVTCNKKLIGAKYYSRGYEAATGPVNTSAEYLSPRDSEGHGTHTASTAGGRLVNDASLLGFAPGAARGMAPKARLAVYKVCWQSGCYDSDILAAFDEAVVDGVDVISLSVGGGVVPYFLDPIAIGSYSAMKRGILISCSAGNSGPGPLTVTNVAPWITTVAASTVDRSFPATVKLGGNGDSVYGTSLYSGPGLGESLLPLIYGLSAAKTSASAALGALCLEGSLDPAKVKGKVVLCDRGTNARVAKGQVVKAAGGAGMILTNLPVDGEGLVADSHVLPATAVGAVAGTKIKAYINSTKTPTAIIQFGGTVYGIKPAPVLSSFSSRGPNPETPEILKPDITAPGVNILAAWTGAAGPTGLEGDDRRVSFNIISGTSMSCPHISGIAALLKAARPDWSPAAIKSAIMTTAYLKDNAGNVLTDEATGNMSNPFVYGAGHVDPERAVNPGLVYDLGPEDYVGFLCAVNYSLGAVKLIDPTVTECPSAKLKSPSDLNYPSVSVVFDQTGTSSTVLETSFTRTVTNVGPAKSTYTVTWVAPKGVKFSFSTSELKFKKVNEKQTFTVKVSSSPVKLPPGSMQSAFGFMSWYDGEHSVGSPIVVNWQQSYPASQ
ncbi:hypothetical protein R1sor_014697 [Riccia sorocarpa]|uniref:Subtilisin-like protease SBT1.7 n=1 Tax=Riccia sorocarpa TaxID=122646 RepID=A0ABD3HAL6_9MARC